MPIWCTIRPPLSRSGRIRSVTSTRASTAARPVTTVAQPPFSSPRSAGQLRRHLDEELRLQLRQVRQGAAHRPGRVVLGEPVGGEGEREDVALRRMGPVPRRPDLLLGRVRLDAVQRVLDRRLRRLVVRRQRPVDDALGREQPGLAVALHDERVGTADRVLRPRVVRRHVVRPLGRLEVRHVLTGPAAGLLVPPDVLLPLAPRLALGVGRGTVVEDPAVQRPRPAPLGGHRVLLLARLAPGGLVDLVGVDAAVDPAAAGRRAVVLHLHVARQRRAVRAHAVDLAQHRLGVRVGRLAVRRVVPGEVQQRPVPRVGRSPSAAPAGSGPRW